MAEANPKSMRLQTAAACGKSRDEGAFRRNRMAGDPRPA